MTRRGTDILRYWLPALIWIGIIAFESFSLSSERTGKLLRLVAYLFNLHFAPATLEHLNHVLRKAGHFCGYGVLCFLLFRAWLYSLGEISRRKAAALALVVTLLIATLDEWHQSFDKMRTGTPRDVLLDMCGGILFLALGIALYHRTRPSPRPEAA